MELIIFFAHTESWNDYYKRYEDDIPHAIPNQHDHAMQIRGRYGMLETNFLRVVIPLRRFSRRNPLLDGWRTWKISFRKGEKGISGTEIEKMVGKPNFLRQNC